MLLSVNRVLAIALMFLAAGCSNQKTRESSSVVDYLYPKGSKEVIQPSLPILKVPLKVGIAFVPQQISKSGIYNAWSGSVGGGSALTAVTKAELLEKVAANFREYKFINKIEIIPSEYLTAGGSFSNLEQIQKMFDVDVVALVSYDQVQFTDASYLSFTYWTLVGAYVVAGEKNDTSTMLDTVVYDIASRKLLFRAPGTSIVKGRSTPVNLGEELRADSAKGFSLAAKEMTTNLQVQLASFKEKIKNNPAEAKIVTRDGYSSGGGATDILLVMFLVWGAARFGRK